MRRTLITLKHVLASLYRSPAFLTTVVLTLAVWLWSLRLDLAPAAQGGFAVLAILALLQLALGIVTLLLVVPVWAAALHQAGAILVLTALLWCLYHLRVRTQGAQL